MIEASANAQRLLQLFEQLRHKRPGMLFMRLNELNLSFTHVRAMHVLSCREPLAMKELAEQLGMTPPSVTALTRRLVQTGMISRTAHTEDSRVAMLALTETGRQLLMDFYHDQLRQMDRLLHGLAAEEQELLLALLARAVQALQSSEG